MGWSGRPELNTVVSALRLDDIDEVQQHALMLEGDDDALDLPELLQGSFAGEVKKCLQELGD